MRTVASYALESSSADSTSEFDEVDSAITEWLIEKGWNESSVGDFQSNQGNETRVVKVSLDPPEGRLNRFLVIERLPEAIFSTEISVAHDSEKCAIYVELRIEGAGLRLQPFKFDARRPKFLGRLLNKNLNWQLGETPLTDKAYNFKGSAGGAQVVDILWHPQRAVPVVMVSLIDGSGITSNFVTKLAGDLAGLAIVATVDEEAAWALTRLKGVEWSCFNGALRLYWPLSSASEQPRLHPIWLRGTMLGSDIEPSNASYRMRAQLRRIILGVSALSIRQPALIRKIDRAARQKRQDELRHTLSQSRSTDEYREIAESYANENDRLREEIKSKEDQLIGLESQVLELQVALRYIPQVEHVEVPPDIEEDPATVADAIDIALEKFSDRLIFSESLSEGVSGLNPEAGPPSRVLSFLRALHELAREREAGGIGVGIIPWLAQRGVACSVESETVRKSKSREWVVGGEHVVFDYHLKPSDGVSPDRCVRIYFDLVDDGKVRIGWIGRHPG